MSSFAKGFGGCLGVFGAICFLFVGGCVFMGFLASTVKIDPPQTPQPPVVAGKQETKPVEVAQPIVAEPEPPSLPKWEAKTTKDDLTDAVVHTSSLQSTNTVSLKFPYQGEQRATLFLTKRGEATSVAFSLERGQLFPGSLLLGNASTKVRIDNELITCSLSPTTGMDTTVFFLNNERLPHMIMTGKEMRIEVEMYQEANQVFVFDLTSGR